MGNYSRDTFNQDKNYVAVCQQQGVPLVDADWNELNDIIRHELYFGLKTALPDGVSPGSSDIAILIGSLKNDFQIRKGSVIINGHPLKIQQDIMYNNQRWRDSNLALLDKVNVIPPLTTPQADRQDLVYLDVWEREVNSTEDANLINPYIGIETCVRQKREVALRVVEGATIPPEAPEGHSFMPIYLLTRKAGQDTMENSEVVDIRPFLYGTKGTREISFPPYFMKVSSQDNWLIIPPHYIAAKPLSADVAGILPLIMPEGAHMTKLKIQGTTDTTISFKLLRVSRDPVVYSSEVLLSFDEGPQLPELTRNLQLERSIPDTERHNVVDNNKYFYCLFVLTVSSQPAVNLRALLSGISIKYEY